MDVFSSTRHSDDVAAGNSPSYLTYLLIGLIFISALTRIVSSKNSTAKTIPQNGAKTVPATPYWIPLLGHIPNMASKGFLPGLRDYYTNGIFALNLAGTTHNIISAPGLVTAFLNQKSSHADFEHVGSRVMRKVFAFPAEEMAAFEKGYAELSKQYKHLLTEPSLGVMVKGTMAKMQENVTNLVSFSSSLVDQTPWERTSSVEIKEDSSTGEQIVEASLLPLIRDFCAHTANPTIMGSNFLTKFPDFFEDIWTLDNAFLPLAAGIPHWFPIPMLTRAHLARKRLIDQLSLFHTAMEREAHGQDPGPDWRDLEDVSALVKARTAIYRKHDFSMRARATCELALLWAANANSNALVFWILNRIYASPELLSRIREEIAPFAPAVQPRREFPIPEPSRLDDGFDLDALCNHCPLLKSCYVESLRLDSASTSMRRIQRDFVLQAKDSEGWVLREGEFAQAMHDLHATDPKYFPDPMVWKGDRHIRGDEKKVDLGSLRPYGGGTSMCKGRSFAFKECMGFVAAIVALWEISPVGGGEWRIPGHRKATGVYGTFDDTRVWVRRRKLS